MECAAGRVDRVGRLEVRPGSADARGLRFVAANPPLPAAESRIGAAGLLKTSQ